MTIAPQYTTRVVEVGSTGTGDQDAINQVLAQNEAEGWEFVQSVYSPASGYYTASIIIYLRRRNY